MSVSLRIFSSPIKLQFHSERTLRLHIIHLEMLPPALFRIPSPIIIRQRGGKHHLPWTVIFQQYGKWRLAPTFNQKIVDSQRHPTFPTPQPRIYPGNRFATKPSDISTNKAIVSAQCVGHHDWRRHMMVGPESVFQVFHLLFGPRCANTAWHPQITTGRRLNEMNRHTTITAIEDDLRIEV